MFSSRSCRQSWSDIGESCEISYSVCTLISVCRIEDVESEVQLALLNHKTVLLDMDPLAVKTYNLIQATIAVNVVDSERQHQV